MTRKIYRTAMGKMVDIGALQLQNENVRAVGNMGVNARGDLLDSKNRPITTRNQQVQKQYGRQTTNVQDQPVVSSNRKTSAKPQSPKVDIPTPPEDFDDDFEKPKDEAISQPEPGGLAAAIARARQIKQEPLKTPREIAQSQAGVKKL